MRYSELVKKYFDDSYPPHVKGFYLGVVIQVIMLCLLAVQVTAAFNHLTRGCFEFCHVGCIGEC